MSNMLIDQVRAYCRQHELFTPGPVAVAVSGGTDSLALLHLLMELRDDLQITLHVATLDHRLRGQAGADDVRFVCDLAASWGIPCTAGSIDVAAKAKEGSLGIEVAARKARYTFLAEVAQQVGASTIAVGHHQDDQAETVLMHVIRGTGLTGLRGILPKMPLTNGLTLVRPLLAIPRAALDGYIRGLGVQSRIDETNADTSYTRNRLRHEILPLLEQINPQVKAALARTADSARQDYEWLQQSLPLSSELPSIPRETFLALAPGQQALWIRRTVQRFSPDLDLSFERTRSAIALIQTHRHGAKLPLVGQLWLHVENDQVIVAGPSDRPLLDCPWLPPGQVLTLKGPGTFDLPGSGWQITISPASAQSPYPHDVYSVLLALPDDARIELRTRQNGDRFAPHGAGGHSQKLSDTFINLKVPVHWRDRVPLLVVNGQIVWFVVPTAQGSRSRLAEWAALPPKNNRKVWQFRFQSIPGAIHTIDTP